MTPFVIYTKVKEGFPLRLHMYQQMPFGTPSSYETEQTPKPYGFPLDFDSLTLSELENPDFDLTRLVARRHVLR